MAEGMPRILLGDRRVTLLRGRVDGLELALSGRVLEDAFGELRARLAEQPSFYRGAHAVANFGQISPTAQDVTRLRDLLAHAGIRLRALCGSEELQALAVAQGLDFEPVAPQLSDSARSLVADFAGARKDIAQRRRRGEASVRRAKVETARPHALTDLRLVDAPPSTLYHAATLRGGQTLHHTGNIVVVGDVNPGAELVATGNVLVFGRLAGIAHAGAQGDEGARIYALDLSATQLRIATYIAADGEAKRRAASAPEGAVVRDGQIVILSLDRMSELTSRASRA